MARIIVTLIFGGFGAFMFFYGLRQFLLQRRLLRNAVPITAVITQSEVFSSRSSDTDARPLRDSSTTTHRPDVRFRYEVNGRSYESDLMYPNSIVVTYASRESAAEALAPYPPGATVRAMVDPGMPDKAFLVAQPGAGPKVFMIVGAVLPPLAWWVGQWV
jgi:hypothetical protein